MNTGMQDAANLSWKLAAAVRGRGGESLLDSYHDERHRIGREVLRSSGAIIRLAMIRLKWARTLRNLLGATLIKLSPVAAMAAGSISGIGLRYPAPSGADSRVGTRMPDIELVGGRFVLVGEAAAGLRRPAQVDAAVPTRQSNELVLVRPDGYIGWIGSQAHFPAWADRYFAPAGPPIRAIRA